MIPDIIYLTAKLAKGKEAMIDSEEGSEEGVILLFKTSPHSTILSKSSIAACIEPHPYYDFHIFGTK